VIGGVQLRLEFEIGRFEVEKRDVHARRLGDKAKAKGSREITPAVLAAGRPMTKKLPAVSGRRQDFFTAPLSGPRFGQIVPVVLT
jgi:hypothetical protein